VEFAAAGASVERSTTVLPKGGAAGFEGALGVEEEECKCKMGAVAVESTFSLAALLVLVGGVGTAGAGAVEVSASSTRGTSPISISVGGPSGSAITAWSTSISACCPCKNH
jgi:hypothetical protein